MFHIKVKYTFYFYTLCTFYVIADNIVTNAGNQNKIPVIFDMVSQKWQVCVTVIKYMYEHNSGVYLYIST